MVAIVSSSCGILSQAFPTRFPPLSDCCLEKGIECVDGRVIKIDLSRQDLHGSIPECLGDLSDLLMLDLSHNKFEGEIPGTLGNIKSLLGVSLNGNHLNGSIAVGFQRLRSLRVLNLGNNRLAGQIPSWIDKLRNLDILQLAGNQFHGKIPETIGNFPRLKVLSLSENNLSGRIPRSLKYLTKLNIIDFSHNELNGPITDVFSTLSNLTQLYLNHNQLTGTIPFSLDAIDKLAVLDVSFNTLSGPLPDWLDHHQFHSLNIASNDFTGTMPELTASVTNSLFSLDVSNNPKLTGVINPEFHHICECNAVGTHLCTETGTFIHVCGVNRRCDDMDSDTGVGTDATARFDVKVDVKSGVGKPRVDDAQETFYTAFESFQNSDDDDGVVVEPGVPLRTDVQGDRDRVSGDVYPTRANRPIKKSERKWYNLYLM